MKKKKKVKISQIVLISILSILCLIWIAPLIYIFLTSLRTDDSIMYDGFKFLPDSVSFESYRKVLANTEGAPIIKWFFNSLISSSITAALVVLLSSLSAYGFSRLKFKGKDKLFAFLMITMMIPSVINLIPNYAIISALNLKNTMLALILPALGGVSNIFLIRQFLYSVPKELDESAAMDGASSFRTFFSIILPQLVPVLVTVALFTFLGSWNDLLWPLIVIEEADQRTLTAGLSLLNGQYDREYASMMAATVLSAIPVLLIYIFAQKYLLQGIQLNSVNKE